MSGEPRSLETLIEQFNRANEIDTASKAVTGETYWIEVDGVRTRMVDAWVSELSSEEKTIFEAHVVQVVDESAKALGYEDSEALFKDAGKKVFGGMTLGIATNG